MANLPSKSEGKSESASPVPHSNPEVGSSSRPGSHSESNLKPYGQHAPTGSSLPALVNHEARPINATASNRFLTRLALKIVYSSVYRRLHPGQVSPPVVNVSSKICIKAGSHTTLAEAHCMQFVAKNTSIPVPKIYCAFEHEGRGYIVMEKLPGRVMLEGWGLRTKESQDKILKQLKDMTDELRSLPPPENIGVANVNGGPIYDTRLLKLSWGPYRTIDEFHKDLREGLEVGDLNDKSPYGLAELIAFHNEHWEKPVFTHGDLSPYNILLDGDKVTGIIDWTTAGWMPSYWEYSQAMNYVLLFSSWADAVNGFLTPLPHALEMDTIRKRFYSDLFY